MTCFDEFKREKFGTMVPKRGVGLSYNTANRLGVTSKSVWTERLLQLPGSYRHRPNWTVSPITRPPNRFAINRVAGLLSGSAQK